MTALLLYNKLKIMHMIGQNIMNIPGHILGVHSLSSSVMKALLLYSNFKIMHVIGQNIMNIPGVGDIF